MRQTDRQTDIDGTDEVASLRLSVYIGFKFDAKLCDIVRAHNGMAAKNRIEI